MSAAQWSALFSGDESYAGARSFERFEAVVRELTRYPEVVPVHQGRAAERIVLHELLGPGDVSVSNTHFDSTRAGVEAAGAEAVDLPVDYDETTAFGGDLDVDRLRRLLAGDDGARVSCVVLTVTNNANGGQPVSIGSAGRPEICDERGVPFLLDASRFAETPIWSCPDRRIPERVRHAKSREKFPDLPTGVGRVCKRMTSPILAD